MFTLHVEQLHIIGAIVQIPNYQIPSVRKAQERDKVTMCNVFWVMIMLTLQNFKSLILPRPETSLKY